MLPDCVRAVADSNYDAEAAALSGAISAGTLPGHLRTNAVAHAVWLWNSALGLNGSYSL